MDEVYKYIMANPLILFLAGAVSGLLLGMFMNWLAKKVDKEPEEPLMKLGPLSAKEQLEARVKLLLRSKEKSS